MLKEDKGLTKEQVSQKLIALTSKAVEIAYNRVVNGISIEEVMAARAAKRGGAEDSALKLQREMLEAQLKQQKEQEQAQALREERAKARTLRMIAVMSQPHSRIQSHEFSRIQSHEFGTGTLPANGLPCISTVNGNGRPVSLAAFGVGVGFGDIDR